MKRLILIICLCIAALPASALRSTEVKSPDGSNTIKISVSKGKLGYEVFHGRTKVVEWSQLGFEFSDGSFSDGISLVSASRRSIDETYTLPVGKVAEARDWCNQLTVRLQNRQGRLIDLVCRAYPDAVAFRYVFPEQDGWNSFEMTEETAQFRLAGDPEALVMYLPHYRTSHEGLYTRTAVSAIPDGQIVEMPATFTMESGLSVAVTEAAVKKYAGMMLLKKDGSLCGSLSPRLDRPELKVIVEEFPHKTPWRVIQIAERVGALIESTVLTSLNDPCAVDDVSWIKPCIKTTFTWWNGNQIPDTTFSPGNNFETNKLYIDFAAEHHIDLHDIYGYAETPWYQDSGFNFGWPAPDADPTKPIRPLDMQRIGDYAASKGVNLHLWVHWLPLYNHLEEALTLFEKWGVKGMMIDFMDRDDQQMIEIQEELLEACARHHLFVQFHGASKPSGMIRTYPNEFTREGTLNYEVCKWDCTVNADHDINIPFTRMLAGAADYHMGGFRAQNRKDFQIHYTNPHVMSTRGHMMGMYIVFENYLTSFCDTPMAYGGQKEFDFLTTLPYGWHDIKVLDAGLGEYVAIARRHGSDWWVGAITNHTARELAVKFDFLEKGCGYTAEVWCDAPESEENPNITRHFTETVNSESTLSIPMVSDGGFIIKISR